MKWVSCSALAATAHGVSSVARTRVRAGLARRSGRCDAANLTVNAMQALARLPAIASMQVDVVIGAAHPQRDQIIQACDDYGFTCHIQTRHMADLMRQADLAIGVRGALPVGSGVAWGCPPSPLPLPTTSGS
ncbi:hypothetical protein WJ973_05320 [Achromobacter xylosoxidans]